MTLKKLIKAVQVEVSEAKRTHKIRKFNIAKACLLQAKNLIEDHLKT